MTTKSPKTIAFIDKRQADKYIERINNLGFSNYQHNQNSMLHFNFPKTTVCFKNSEELEARSILTPDSAQTCYITET
ncbi:hypothetical protein VCR31J2_1270466 [Vibrio coralliirubri]|uniref:Uncharacterized protein n=1 Tax=Vibrio coralliirubri TaxID=1516159 RepID=A0AA86XK21_9VIBR|nr:hypothetical protein VCR31J2_1270466 [Vibrio coralliirubri]